MGTLTAPGRSSPAGSPARPARGRAAALCGIAATAVTLGVAELLAGALVRLTGGSGTPSPLLAVGGAFVDRTPAWLKDWAVETFGTADKVALGVGIGLVMAKSPATDRLQQTMRLLQFACAYAEVSPAPTYEDPFKVNVTLMEPSSKIDAFVDDIKNGDFGDSSVAVTAVSRQVIDLLSARLTKEKIEHGLVVGNQSDDVRQAHIDDFQAGKTKFILFTAQAGGVGVTLTAARYLVRLQRPWSLIDDKQVEDRVHRIGSEIHSSIIILDYYTEDTVEDDVLKALDIKGGNLEEVVLDRNQLIHILKGAT